MDFKPPFRLDFIKKTSYGSLFQALIVLALFLEYQRAHLQDSWILMSLFGAFFTQIIRFLIYLRFRKSEEKLLEAYWPFAGLSCASAISWGMVACTSLMRHGLTGIGTISFVACTSIACATAHATAAVLSVQRIFTVLILTLPAIGIIVNSLPHPDWMTVGLIGVVALYSFYLAQKQHSMMQILFEQRERIRMDLLAARTIQQSLLPALNLRFGRFDFEMLYQPCEDLSGDFFEIQSLGENILFYVADVTSHGTASAQVTYLLKGLFKSVLPDPSANIDLPQITRKLALGYAAYGLNYSISLLMGNLNAKTGTLEFISSNFPGPVLIELDQSQTIPTSPNPIIDAMVKEENYEFAMDRIELRPGASLFVFTDGAFELKSRAAGQNLSNRQLRKILAQADRPDWKELILSQLQSISQTTQFPDDVTIMKIHYLNSKYDAG